MGILDIIKANKDALQNIEYLAKNANFLSIGTNDLISSLFDINRINSLNKPLNDKEKATLLDSIKLVADTAKKYNISVSVCGEIAHDTSYVLDIINLGINQLTMDLDYIYEINEYIKKADK